MFARIENAAIVEWPIYDGQLLERFPNLRFPFDFSVTPLPAGYVEVDIVPPTQPQVVTSDYNEGLPALLNGRWTLTWVETPLTGMALTHRIDTLSADARLKRDRLLRKTDFTQIADAPLDASRIASYKIYRQALRDITISTGFPTDITWPLEPLK